jgi:hypothetical protein
MSTHLFRGRKYCYDCQALRSEHTEPTCAKCLQVVELSGQPDRERYEMRVLNPDGTEGMVYWKVHKARAMVRADPRAARRLDHQALMTWLEQHAEAIDYDHLDHIPTEQYQHGAAPGLMVIIDELDPDRPGHFRAQPILIDGTHRAARAVRAHESFFVYVLTDAETMACVESEGIVTGETSGAQVDLNETGMEAAS